MTNFVSQFIQQMGGGENPSTNNIIGLQQENSGSAESSTFSHTLMSFLGMGQAEGQSESISGELLPQNANQQSEDTGTHKLSEQLASFPGARLIRLKQQESDAAKTVPEVSGKSTEQVAETDSVKSKQVTGRAGSEESEKTAKIPANVKKADAAVNSQKIATKVKTDTDGGDLSKTASGKNASAESGSKFESKAASELKITPAEDAKIPTNGNLKQEQAPQNGTVKTPKVASLDPGLQKEGKSSFPNVNGKQPVPNQNAQTQNLSNEPRRLSDLAKSTAKTSGLAIFRALLR